MNRFIAATPAKCIGCRTCEVACVLAHANHCEGACALAEPNPAADRPSCLSFMPRLTVIKTETVSTVVNCHHCEDAPCANACPSGAIVYRKNSVQIDQDRCLGCKTCMMACPFGAMNVITVPGSRMFAGVAIATGRKAQAHKCDLCIDREGGPACVSVCPTKALRLVDRASMDETLRLRQERSVAALMASAAL
ncbi:MAG: 4Fe-4S dicluster domain-containing protein [Telmatospirillum sp.]|nr:4Fe-4S dicluster domain-containing protein [Telmatospirillum sp.]